MSRIGKLPVTLPQDVTATIDTGTISITGPKGSVTLPIPSALEVKQQDSLLTVSNRRNDKPSRSAFGAFRSHIQNAVTGVVTPWTKSVEIRGTGYKFVLNGNKLVVTCGFIHPVNIIFPEGIFGQLTDDTKLVISGVDRQVVGQVASNIRKIKPPEPYKGKGIRYQDEFVKLKAGKTAKS